MQSENTLVQDTKKEMVKNEESPKLSNDESKSSIIELFPWVLKFKQMCKCVYTGKSMASLTELMQFYVRNVGASVNECYTKPLKAEKLKDFISETLMLFLYIYRELSEDQNRLVYLSNMSDLLALYIDMELKTSRKRTESHDKICARLTCCLYVYLEHSVEHLLDTLMKIQFMCHSYHDILDPVITKVVKNIPAHPESSTMYLRYFFIYCLWRKINDNVAVKNEITATALASLGPLPSAFSPNILEDVLPKVPKNQPNSTEALLQHKFDIKKHCDMFLQYCKESNGNTCQKDGPATLIDSSSSINSKMPEDNTSKDVVHVDNVNSVISDKNKQNESISMLKPLKFQHLEKQTSFKCLDSFSNNISTKQITPSIIKSNKNCSQRKCKKSNEIVIIDLTSDVVLEKCIKKRKFRKLPWLEEAKKKIDMKIIKASQKIKKKKKQKQEADHTHRLNILRSYQTNDALQSSCSVEKVSSRNDSNACRTVGVKNNENNVEMIVEAVNCTENARKLTGTEVNIKEINLKASPGTVAPVLTEIFPSKKQISKVSDIVISSNYLNNGDVSNIQSDEKENDRYNKQTVIKRLIETDIFSESEACEKVESLKKICDLETERPAVNNTAVSTQYYFKGDTVKSNRSKFNVISDEITERNALSINKELEQNEQNVSNDGTSSSVVRSSETTDYSRNVVDSEITNKEFKLTDNVEASQISDALQSKETQPSSEIINENSVTEENFKPRAELESSKCTSTMVNAEKEDLRSYNYEEANKDAREDKSSIANSRESIFESYSIHKKDISNENSCIDRSLRKSVEDIVNNKCDSEFNKCDDKSDVPDERNELSRSSLEANLKSECDKSYKMTEQDDKYNIAQDTELQDSIDGLSLLASVSQRVPHLKPEFEVKCDQIKVKDYASLKYNTSYNQTDDETDTNDSSNAVSQLFENPSSEIINRIVGIYPEDALNKVLPVEVTSNGPGRACNDDELCKVVSQSVTEVNYESDILTNNLTPIESSMQTVKENTNVILNGETVVLLQKSPNSNLYIINKAVENSKDHGNDEVIGKLKEKAWVSEEFEAVASLDHAYNLELTLCSKELPYQENKCSVARGKGIKMEPEDGNFSDTKSYSTKVPLSTDMLPVNSQMYQDVSVMSKSMDKRKPSKSSLPFRQNIKQEFNNISSHISPNCVIPGCNRIHSHSHEVDAQHPLHIPATHSTTLPSIYGNCAGNGDLCVPYHKHCTSVSCATSLRPHTKSASPCGRSRCSCLNCTYDIVAHCRQCIHPTADAHVSCIESNPYFLPTQSPVQSPAVQEHDRTKNETVIGKLYDDQLLCKIEKSLLQSNTLEKLEVQCESKKIFRKEADNKLPLKKRLKAHAMAYEEMPIKAEKMDNYPAVPMMSIAALEASDSTQKRSVQILKSKYELSPTSNEDPRNGYHCGSSLARRGYYKDVTGAHENLTKENTRKSDSAVCQESCLQRTVKTTGQRKEINLSDITSLKQFEIESMGDEGTYKKVKKTPLRQTRSSKRNVPKVNYSYTDVDPEWNPSGESKRKRKKTSR